MPPPSDEAQAPCLLGISSEIDTRICSLHRAADALRDIVESTRHDSPVFNFATFETRVCAITEMRQLHAELQKLMAVVAKNGAAAEVLHRSELKAAQEGLNRAQIRTAQNTPAWVKVAPDARAPAAAVPRPIAPRPEPGASQVKVVGDLTVEAVTLPESLKKRADIFAAIAPGGLYFVPHWNHFAARIGGCVFHANLGRIYRGIRGAPRDTPRELPECVKECRNVVCKGREAGCRYYHDPELFADSTDVRNFMADSWYYTSATAPAHYGTRRIGSASEIEVDIRAISPEDARRFLHQTAHDVLCALILWQQVIVPAVQENRCRG